MPTNDYNWLITKDKPSKKKALQALQKIGKMNLNQWKNLGLSVRDYYKMKLEFKRISNLNSKNK